MKDPEDVALALALTIVVLAFAFGVGHATLPDFRQLPAASFWAARPASTEGKR